MSEIREWTTFSLHNPGIRCVRVACSWLLHTNMMTSSTNRKYITYCSDRATAMDNMHKIWWSCDMWILSKCGKDWAFNSGYMLAVRKTNRHAHTHTQREREKETCMVTILRCLPGVRNSEEQFRRNYKLICRSWVEWVERRVDNKILQSGGSQKCR